MTNKIIIAMDYDKSNIAATYNKARELTPARQRRWRDLLAAHVDRSTISLVVDLGCGTPCHSVPAALLERCNERSLRFGVARALAREEVGRGNRFGDPSPTRTAMVAANWRGRDAGLG